MKDEENNRNSKVPDDLGSFSAFVQIVKELRGPQGCPWDREQTHRTLTKYVIEEAFELSDAIEGGEVDEICDELGDLLLQVVLHSEISRQDGNFSIDDVIRSISEKMVRRHPHVFAETSVSGTQEVIQNWHEIKESEKKQAGKKEKLDRFDIPVHLPSLQRSAKIGAKTRKLNFDWDKASDVLLKVHEELSELQEAMKTDQNDKIAEEMGDLLFSTAQLARHLKLDPEQCLRDANRKFENRFFRLKTEVERSGRGMVDTPKDQLEEGWERVKSEGSKN